MAIYISLLRGINVTGQNPIKMDALRKAYEDMGFSNVTTYVNSGNVIFTSEKINVRDLELEISRQIEKNFQLRVPVLVITDETLKKIIDNNPFIKETEKESHFLYVTFLSSKPEIKSFQIIEDKKQPGEQIAFSDIAIYLYCPHGYGKTKLNNNFIESKLKVIATTRNWKTTNELLNVVTVCFLRLHLT